MLETLAGFFWGNVRRRLVTSVALVHAVMMGLFIWDLTVRQQVFLVEQLEGQARSLASSVTTSAAGWMAARDLAGLQEVIDAQKQYPGLTFVMALDNSGLILAHSDRERRGQYVLDMPKKSELATMTRKASLADVAHPVRVGDKQVGWVRIGLSQDESGMQLAAITRDGILYAIVAIVTGMLIAALTGARLTARLREIQSVADKVGSGRADARIISAGNDEVAILARQFNHMLDAVEHRDYLLRQTQALAHLGSWEFDVRSGQLTWSDEVYRIFGLLPQEFPVGYEDFIAAVHPDDRERVNRSYQDSISENCDQYELEHRIIRHGTGEVRHVHEKGLHVRNEQQQIIRTVGMVHDITEMHDVLHELERNQGYLRHLIEFVPDAILSVDEDQCILSFNASAELLFGYAAAEVIGKPLDILLPSDVRAQHREQVRHFSTDRTTVRRMGAGRDVRGLCKDGREVSLEVSFSKLKVDGKMVYLATARDITERKQVEHERGVLQGQLLQAQKMESIGHLTGGIAHDFNNMLGAMMGYAELLELSSGMDADKERNRAYIREILTAGNRAKELIAQMLIFSRQRTDAQDGETPVMLLQPLIKEVVQMLRASIPSMVEVNVNIDEPGLKVRIQPVQLQQVLLNLGINARDAIGEYGSISIGLRRATLQANCQSCCLPFAGDYAELRVVDSGGGIPSAVLGKIFDPFFTTKAAGKGTGMGLSVVHGIVHAAGGHVLLESSAGKGTVFRVFLPLEMYDSASDIGGGAASKDEVDCRLENLHILVVDDERVLALMLEELFNMHGARVAVYTSSTEALQAFRRDPGLFDAVVTDENMPDLSGLDMARVMIKMRPDIPVILCTGYSDHINAEMAQKEGMYAFMYKPVDMSKLLAHLQALAQRKR